MSAERSLFDMTMEMGELARYIERVADQKCVSYHISFGMSKGASAHKSFTTIVVLEPRQKKSDRKIIEGDSFRNLFDQVNEFLKTI